MTLQDFFNAVVQALNTFVPFWQAALFGTIVFGVALMLISFSMLLRDR